MSSMIGFAPGGSEIGSPVRAGRCRPAGVPPFCIDWDAQCQYPLAIASTRERRLR